ncbi:MAG: cation:dicarboxylase symporter family transporter [Bacteroidetes bacterium]|nr:cation:dicarboxylase symporter family transporter [Bacteroidota bacterium]
MKKVFTNLTFWVLVAITAGALLGNFYPDTAIKTEWLGKTFIELIKYFIYPIIFFTISLGISNMGNIKKAGRVGGKAILYFEIITTFALLTGMIVSHLIQPGSGVNISEVKAGDISNYLKQAETFTWLGFLKENPTLQILIISIIFGIWLSGYEKKESIVKPLTVISKYVFKALHFAMLLAPIGAFGGMASTVSKFGLQTLLPLGKLMITVYITCLCFIFIILGLLLMHYKISILKYLKYIREELLIVLGTSSSEVALPSLIEKLERFGCSKSVTGLVVPAGYSFNLDGTTIYLSMAIMFLAQVYHIDLTLHQAFVIIGVLLITSKGAAGVTGSGFIVLASTLSAVKVIPMEGLAFLLGVDRFMSEARALTNFIGNGVATIWISNNEKEFDYNKMKMSLNNFSDSEKILAE